MATIFTRIIQGEIPCHRVAESGQFLALLDIRPVALGHTIVVPKLEVDYFFDLDDRMIADLMSFAKGVAKALREVVPCKRIGLSVVGLEVPHAHLHLIPLQSMEDMNFLHPPLQMEPAELAALAEKIASRYQG